MSRMESGTWSQPVCVADGVTPDGRRYPTWNPVLFQVPGGPLLLFYKVGPDPGEWWGMLKTSEDFGSTWSEAYRLPEGIVGPTKNKPLLMDDGRLICPSSREGENWEIYLDITDDLGTTWRTVGPLHDPQRVDGIQPCILDHGKGKLQLLARSRSGSIVGAWSCNRGRSWGQLRPMELPNPNSAIDAVTLDNEWQMLVYNHSRKEPADWGGSRSPLNVAVSKDGKTWRCALTLEQTQGADHYRSYSALIDEKSNNNEYSYPSIVESGSNSVEITYTYNRYSIKHVTAYIQG